MNLSQMSHLQLLDLQADICAELLKRDELALRALQAGREVAGYTLRNGRKTRKIINDAHWGEELMQLGIPHNIIFTTKTTGIPAVEKYCKAHNKTIDISSLITEEVSPQTAVYTG